MSVAFQQPAWAWAALAILPAAAVAAAMASREGRPFAGPRSWRWRLAGILLPGIAAALIALALAGASLVTRTQSMPILLLDFSASARTSPWHDPAWVCALVERRLGSHRRITIAGFSVGPPKPLLEHVTAADAQAWPVIWPSEMLESLDAASSRDARTDIASALQWLPGISQQTTAAPRVPRWIITDGLFHLPPVDASPLAMTIVSPAAIDLAIRDLRVRSLSDDVANPQVEILTQVRATAWPAIEQQGLLPETITAELVISRDGAAIATEPFSFHPATESGRRFLDSSRWISIRDTLDAVATAQPHRYQASIRLIGRPHDPWPENDAASAVWAPPGSSRMLLLTQHTEDHSAWPSLGAAFQRIGDFHADAQRLAAEGWQAVILDDIPAEADPNSGLRTLSPTAAQTLDRFVHDSGAGLLILTRGHAFGPGRYGEGSPSGDTLEQLSPFWSHPHTGPALHVIYLLDASASMNEAVATTGGQERKIRLLTQGVVQSTHLLSADDRITLLTFNDRSQMLLSEPFGPAAQKIANTLAAIEPGGPTNFDSTLPNLAAALKENTPPPAGAEHTLVFLITDGEIPSINVPRFQELLAGTAQPLQFCIVAPPPPATATSPLRQLAAAIPNTQWLQTTDPAAWAALLRQAVAAQVRGRVQSGPLPWQFRYPQNAAAPPPDGIAPSWTHVWLKPESILLAQGKGETSAAAPLAAVAQRGLGKVAAIAITRDDSPSFQAMRSQVLSQIAAGPGDRRNRVFARQDRGAWLVAADAVADHAFINGQSLALRLLTPDNPSPPDIPFQQTAPGHYEARVSAAQGLTGTILRKNLPPAGAPVEELVARLQTPTVQTAEWPATVEHPFIPADSVQMLSPDPADTTFWSPESDQTISLAPALWIAAVIASLGALYLRH